SDVTVHERIDGVLARNVGFVQLHRGDATYGLTRAVVNGVPIGDFPQYEDLVGLVFTVPPLLTLDGRASGEAAAGNVALHQIRLTHALYGRAFLDAIADHPSATGVPIHAEGKTKARNDGGLGLDLEGKVVVVDQKVKLKVNHKLYPGQTALTLVAK